MINLSDILTEGFKIKVNSKGVKKKKRICPKGMKVSPSGSGCVPIKATEKQAHKVGSRKAQRKIKSGGAALKRRKLLKTRKALRFRKNLGLHR